MSANYVYSPWLAPHGNVWNGFVNQQNALVSHRSITLDSASNEALGSEAETSNPEDQVAPSLPRNGAIQQPVHPSFVFSGNSIGFAPYPNFVPNQMFQMPIQHFPPPYIALPKPRRKSRPVGIYVPLPPGNLDLYVITHEERAKNRKTLDKYGLPTLTILEKSFATNVVLSRMEKERLQGITDLTVQQISLFFRNQQYGLTNGNNNSSQRNVAKIVSDVQTTTKIPLYSTASCITGSICYFIQGRDSEGKVWRLKNRVLECLSHPEETV